MSGTQLYWHLWPHPAGQLFCSFIQRCKWRTWPPWPQPCKLNVIMHTTQQNTNNNQPSGSLYFKICIPQFLIQKLGPDLTPNKESFDNSMTDRAASRRSSTAFTPPGSSRLREHLATPWEGKRTGGLLGAGGVHNGRVEVEPVDRWQWAEGEHLTNIGEW